MRTERKSPGYWPSLENTIVEARIAMKKEGWTTLPVTHKLEDTGYSALSSAIYTYHGGFHKFRQILGENPLRTAKGLWPDLNYAIKQAKEAMEREGWTTLPNIHVLQEQGYCSLASAITRHHGGYYKFRKALGQEPLMRERNLWPNQDYAIQQAKQIMEKEGWDTLPCVKTLRNKGYIPLERAIFRYHRGIIAFNKLLSEKTGINPDKAKLENLLSAYVRSSLERADV